MSETPVDSTCLDIVTYTPATLTLTLQFDIGGSYSYEGISQAIHDALIAADSKGLYFNTSIRNEGFSFHKL